MEVKRLRQSKEHIEQVKFVGYVRLFYPEYILFSVPNGAAVSASQRIRLAKEGMLAGVPDLMVISPKGRWLGIEMKRKQGGVVSEAQYRLKEALIERGVVWYACEGFEAAKEAFGEFKDQEGV